MLIHEMGRRTSVSSQWNGWLVVKGLTSHSTHFRNGMENAVKWAVNCTNHWMDV